MGSKWLRVVMVMISVLVLEAGLSNGCWEQERFALLQLKSFFFRLQEEESSDCCQWKRVECNITTRRVTKLSLSNTLPYISTEKWYLNVSLFIPFEELRSLYLNQNEIVGCVENEGFEKLSKLSRLEVLDLSSNQFNASILSSLSKISSLKSLNLAGNDLFTRSNHTNDLKWLSTLSSLETLDLSETNVRNNFLLHLGSLSSLTTLILSGNYLEGTIQIQGKGRQLKLINLEVLDLSLNLFNNSILADLSGFSNLKSLDLRRNQLNGSINIKEFCAWSNLETLDMSGNKVNQFVNSKENEKQLRLINLEVLDLSGNYFNNSILADLSWFPNLKSLDIRENQLQGSVDVKELCALSNLEILDMSSNAVNQFVTSKENERQLRLINLEVLDLRDNHFNNSILADLSWFPNLKSLDISQNQLNGSINVKELCALSNLETLDMSSNAVNQFVTSKENRCLKKLKNLYLNEVSTKRSFSVISLLEAFSSVKTLFLRSNSYLNKTVLSQELHVLSNVENLFLDFSPLDIKFLQSIGSLTSLKTLSLGGCGLTGTLPDQGWCYLKSLEELNLKGNAIGGSIVSCLGNLTFLRFLDISFNQFTGNVASTPLTNLTMLQYLSFSNNYFQVPISFMSFANHSDLKILFSDENKLAEQPVAFQTWFPKFQLKVFTLSNCIIEGHRKLQLPNFLYYQYDLRFIDLSYINFGGIKFPDWLLENNTRLEQLYMKDSSIVGPLFLPSHPNYNLWVIDISNNKIQNQIPPNFCSLFPNLENLFMSRNAFKSSIPLCLGGMRSLLYLDMSHNQLLGGIPEELVKSDSLVLLGLSNNSLSGKMFPAIYRSNMLSALYLDGNNFDGDMPQFSPISSSMLETLDISDSHLSGKLPGWLWNKTYLMVLDLSNNHFDGPIPVELCNMVGLKFLDLSQNNLSGTLPSCFNLDNVQHVHLSKNKLSGPLLNTFYGSSSLVTLDLSHNNFSGEIPYWSSKLPALSVLLLKANQFHGEFPMHLCKLYSLSIVDLSQNKLSGPIPSCLSNLTLKPRVEKSDISTTSSEFFSLGLVLADMGLKIYDLGENIGLGSSFDTPLLYPRNYVEEEIVFSTKSASYNYTGDILDSLSGIDLSCNQLTGIIPSELGNLSEIRALNLSHNNLTGPIPSTFSKLKQIESLDLSYNNLNGRIPPQLTELYTLEVFTVAYNNLSGPLPDMKAQFGTFSESSYEGNPHLCGPPLNSCSEGDSPETPSVSSSEDEEHGFIDMGDFYICFGVSYAIILLGIAIVLYINPYWRRAWFYLIEKHSTACYFFIVDSLQRLPCFRRNI